MKQQDGQAPRRSRQSRRRISMLVQVGLAAALIIGIWISWQASQRPSLAIPKQLGTLKLASSVSGAEAKAQISKLHGTHIELDEAYIAEYAGADARVTAWVSAVGSSSEAAWLLQRMLDGIRDGNPVFSNLQQQAVDGHEVYSVDSRDGKQYFYLNDKKVIWLQVAAAEPLPVVRSALKTL